MPISAQVRTRPFRTASAMSTFHLQLQIRCRRASKTHIFGRIAGFQTGGRWFSTSPPTREQQRQAEKLKILFMGRDEFSCLVLQELFAAKDVWDHLAAVTTPNTYIGRRKSQLSVAPLKNLCTDLGVEIHYIPESKRDFRQWPLPRPFDIDATQTESENDKHVLITASFGRILTKKHLSAFPPHHRINVHPSLLPKHRGPAPIQHTLLQTPTTISHSGQWQTGVSIVQMLPKDQGIDAGPLFAQDSFSIRPQSDFTSLRDFLGKAGGQTLVGVLRNLLVKLRRREEVELSPQVGEPTHAGMIKPQDGQLDFTEDTAEDITRRYRAFGHQRPLYTFFNGGKTIQFHGVSISESKPDSIALVSGKLVIPCAGSSWLEVKEVKVEGRNRIPAKSWWNGLRSAPQFTSNPPECKNA